jgi:F-box-like
MSLFSFNPANQLSDDVLLVIFENLDDEDLIQCETVCRQWRKVLLSGKPWARFFQRKIVSSPQWRQDWRNFVPDENKLQTAHCRSLCRAIIQDLKQVDRNWRTGNFKKTSRKVDSFNNEYTDYDMYFVIGCDYIALDSYGEYKDNLKFLHRSSLKLKSFIVIPGGWAATTNAEIAVLWNEKIIKILDTDGQLISEVPELDEGERISWKLVSCCLSNDQMAVLSRTKGEEKLSLWNVRNPANAICLKSRWSNLDLELEDPEEESFSMIMDDQFIAVSTGRNDQSYRASIYFFSKETLDMHWQKTVHWDGITRPDFVYDKGMLLLRGEKRRKYEMIPLADYPDEMYDVKSEEDDLIEMYDEEELEKSEESEEELEELEECDEELEESEESDEELEVSEESEEFEGNGLIEMYDVQSGRCFRKLPALVFDLCKSVCFNSKFMVVLSSDDGSTKLKIYDLKDIKDPESEANELIVLTVDTVDSVDTLTVDETEIFLADYNVMHRLDFRSFEGFRNEAKSVTLSLPWRSVWRSKGVDEEPLKPARHIEVYAEVVQYFHQLDMDCQAAIKTYPVGDANLEYLTLGDDFIGCGPKMSIYDENMVIHQQGMNCKTVQINQTTYVSVTGKIIQLINSTTGNVVQEFRLNRDAINLHSNCNLLVFVCKIRKHEHLLSIWRVDNSANLTHLKDVAIGDYEGSLKVDEKFIAVKTGKRAWTEKTFNFISMKTFQVERSLSSCAKYLQYDGGYLFVSKTENLVGILDVASGTFLRDISIKPSKNNHMIFRVNSNYVVMNNLDSKLHVYDLKCLKETDAVPSHLLLTTIDLECSVKEVLMDETRILCVSNNKMFVVDLKPIDRLRCPESS